MKIVAPKWKADIQDRLDRGQTMDETLPFNPASQWLIAELSRRNLPFAVHNLGAGVKRITTETNKCPCCKRTLP